MLEEVLKKVKNLFRKDSGNHSLCKQRSEKQKNQFIIVGHGMVEMLAVLALVGVLSVGGVTWYQSSLRKAKSNDLWKEVMLRSIATRTAPDFMILKNGEEFNLAGLSNTTSNGYTIKSLKSNGASYYIELSNVPSATCKTMLNSVPEGVRHITVGDGTMYDGRDKSICDSESAMRFAVCFGVTCTSVDLCKNVDCGDNGWCNQAEGICYCNQGFVRDAANNSCIVDPCQPEMRCCNGGSKVVSEGICSCQCLWPWKGSDCTELDNVCMPTVSGHSSIDCGAHGQCIEDPSSDVPTKSPKCECDNCYSGNLCDQRDECCFQMIENPNLCSGRGDCFDVSDGGRVFLSCNCDPGYKNTKFYSKEYHTADSLAKGEISCDTCDTGYYRSNQNTCSSCPTNEGVEGWSQEDKATTFNGSCAYQVHADCETVYLPQGAACVLGELNGVCSETHECVPDCGETAWWNGTDCACLEGYYGANGIIDNETHTCTACPENSFNEGMGNPSCTCAVGYFSTDGTTNNETHTCTPCCPDDPEGLEPNLEKCPPSTTEPGQKSCTCADKEWVQDSSSQYYNTCAIVCGAELCNEGQYCKDANTSHEQRTPLECADLPLGSVSIYVGEHLYTNFKPGAYTSWWDADSICEAYGSSLPSKEIIGHMGDAAQWIETDLYKKWVNEFLLSGKRKTWLADEVSSNIVEILFFDGTLSVLHRARIDSQINEFVCQKKYTPNCSENSTFDSTSGSCLCDIGYYNAVDGTSDNGQTCTKCADGTFNYEKGSKFCCGAGQYIADTNESDYFPHPDHCAAIPTSPDWSFLVNGYKMDIYATNKVPSWWDSNNLCKALGQTLMTAEVAKWTDGLTRAQWQENPESLILWNNISPYTSWMNYTFMQPERYGEAMYLYTHTTASMRNIGYTSKLKSPSGHDVVVVCQEPFSASCPANATLSEEGVVDCQCDEGYYAEDGGRTMACAPCSSGTYNVGTGNTMCCTSGVEYMKDTNESSTIRHPDHCAAIPTSPDWSFLVNGYKMDIYATNKVPSWWDSDSLCKSLGKTLMTEAAVKWAGSNELWRELPESVVLYNNISPYTSWAHYTFMQTTKGQGEAMYFYSSPGLIQNCGMAFTSKLKSPSGHDVVVVCQEPFSPTCPANAALSEEGTVECQCNEGYYAEDGGRTMACTPCSSGTYNVGTGNTICCTSGVEYMKATNESSLMPHRTSCAAMPAVKLAYQEGGTTYNYYGYKRNNYYSWWDAESICASAGGHLLSIAEYGNADGSLADRMISYWESQGITWNGEYGYYGAFVVWTTDTQNTTVTRYTLTSYSIRYYYKTEVTGMPGVLCAIP